MTAEIGRRRTDAIERRRSLEPTERSALSAAVATAVMASEWYLRCEALGLYLASGGEVDPAQIGVDARRRGTSTWYPLITDDAPMRFRRWDGRVALQVDRLGIPVPPPGDEECDAADLDAMLVPVVLFGPGGLRVGRGGGHYDRTLATRARTGRPPVLCGLAYDFQEDLEITPREWDVPLDVVVTPTRTVG